MKFVYLFSGALYNKWEFKKCAVTFKCGIGTIFTVRMTVSRIRIHNTSFSSQLMKGPNKPECYVTLDWKGSPWANTLAYWPHSWFAKKMKCCVYDSVLLSFCLVSFFLMPFCYVLFFWILHNVILLNAFLLNVCLMLFCTMPSCLVSISLVLFCWMAFCWLPL